MVFRKRLVSVTLVWLTALCAVTQPAWAMPCGCQCRDERAGDFAQPYLSQRFCACCCGKGRYSRQEQSSKTSRCCDSNGDIAVACGYHNCCGNDGGSPPLQPAVSESRSSTVEHLATWAPSLDAFQANSIEHEIALPSISRIPYVNTQLHVELCRFTL